MIVSASYRTDIPAFYGDWFLARLRAGHCTVANPYGGKPYTVSLNGPDVDGFVFWTRNLASFSPISAELRRLEHGFVVQMTITGYPKPLEAAGQPPERAISQLRALAEAFGPRVAVWRYDPILFTPLTPPDWHSANFAGLAGALAGATDEVVVSLADDYRKSRRNLALAGIEAEAPPADLAGFLADLAATAAKHGMRLTACTEPGLDLPPARCIDAERLSQVCGLMGARRPIKARQRGNRPGCLCAESRDIGAYDSCAQGCAYCYAVRDRDLAKKRLAAHRPGAEMLIPPMASRPPTATRTGAR